MGVYEDDAAHAVMMQTSITAHCRRSMVRNVDALGEADWLGATRISCCLSTQSSGQAEYEVEEQSKVDLSLTSDLQVE